ncbi:MAG: hypothetical protein IKR35_02210, partial [Lachnospiraceae bacterium]|nr:hypothetical protein [Lachnospiraceae bacterium]
MKTKLKRILSVLLITAQVMTCFTGCGIGDGSFFDIFKKKVTVSFALPDDASLFDKEETYLPEPVKVKKGTLVASMPESNRTSSIFMGYSYDPEGLKSAGESDSIEEDLTLYPQFKISEGMTNVFDMNFVSGQDVSSDYTIELSAYGLTEAEVRELITLKDLSLGEEEVPYLIEENGATLPADLNISERVMPYVKNLIESNLEDNTVNLSEGLDALGLDSDTIYRLVLIYAPEERVTFLNEIAKKTGDEPLTGFAESEIIGIGNKTENELKALYGLEEGESLEKYWREELGYELEDVLRLSDVVKANSVFAETSRFIVKPSEEGWAEGDLFQIEILNTERLR